jgi:hypothetical protein
MAVFCLAAAVGLWTLAGCGLGKGGEEDDSGADDDSHASDIRQIRQGVNFAGEAWGDAHGLLVNTCMAEAGFPGEWTEAGTSFRDEVVGDEEAAESLDPWYGVANAKSGAAWGYHEPQSRQVEIPGREVPDTYWVQLGECMAPAEEAMREGMGVSQEEHDQVQIDIINRVDERTRADTTGVVAEAAEKWRECMSAEGYQYPDPPAAFNEFAPSEIVEGQVVHGYAHAAASEEEKRVAEADGACKEKVDFWDAVEEATFAAETELGEELRTLIDSYLDDERKIAENAAAIIAAHTE